MAAYITSFVVTNRLYLSILFKAKLNISKQELNNVVFLQH